jgi:hypothetical protein
MLPPFTCCCDPTAGAASHTLPPQALLLLLLPLLLLLLHLVQLPTNNRPWLHEGLITFVCVIAADAVLAVWPPNCPVGANHLVTCIEASFE